MRRKEFIKNSGAAALLLSLGIPLQNCTFGEEEPAPSGGGSSFTPPTGGGGGGGGGNTVTFNLGNSPFSSLDTVDTWLLHPSENILLVNVAGTIRAFTSVCTHSGCSRDWSQQNNNIECTCHGSVFNQSGGVVQGPASSNLREYQVQVEENTVTITL